MNIRSYEDFWEALLNSIYCMIYRRIWLEFYRKEKKCGKWPKGKYYHQRRWLAHFRCTMTKLSEKDLCLRWWLVWQLVKPNANFSLTDDRKFYTFTVQNKIDHLSLPDGSCLQFFIVGLLFIDQVVLVIQVSERVHWKRNRCMLNFFLIFV